MLNYNHEIKKKIKKRVLEVPRRGQWTGTRRKSIMTDKKAIVGFKTPGITNLEHRLEMLEENNEN
jgi:hypothetical protein